MSTLPSLTTGQLLGIVVLAVILDVLLVIVADSYFQRHQVGPSLAERLRYLAARITAVFPRIKSLPATFPFIKSLLTAIKNRILEKNWGGVDLPVLALSVYLVGYGLWDYPNKLDVGWGGAWLSLITGIALFILLTPPGRKKNTPEAVSADGGSPGKPKIWQIVCLVGSPILAVISSMAAGPESRMGMPVVAIASWLAGITCAVVGGWQFKTRFVGRFSDRLPVRQRSKKIDYVAVLTVVFLVGIAFIIRGVAIADIPINLSGDEAESGLTALEFLNGNFNNPFVAGWFLFPSLYSAIQAFFIHIFGQTVEALRWSSVIIGSFTVGAVYWVAQSLYGKRTALFASIFLSAYYFHNHFSRLGLNNAWDIFWYTIAFGALWLAWNKQSRPFFLLAGFAVGIAQYFYVSARMMPFLIFGWLLIVGILDLRRLWNCLAGIGLMGLVAVVTILPMALYYSHHLDQYLAPISRVSALVDASQLNPATFDPAWQFLFQNIGRSFLGYVHLPMGSIYTLKLPLLRFPSAILFCFGIGVLLTRLRDSRTLLLLVWLAGFGLLGGLSENAPAAQRMVAVIPAAAILVGYGLAELVRRFNATRLGLNYRRLGELLALVAVVLISAEELRYYFLDYTPNGWFDGRVSMIAQRMSDLLQTKGNDWEVVFVGTDLIRYNSIQSVSYLAPEVIGTTITQEENIGEVYTPSRPHQLFLIIPERQEELEKIRKMYPGDEVFSEYYQSELLFFWYEFSDRSRHIK